MAINRNYSFALSLATALLLPGGMDARAAGAGDVKPAQPDSFTGTLYEMGSGTNKILYTFKRTATRSNGTLRVVRDFSYPNGSLAAQEILVYQSGQLDSFFLDEKQTGASGRAKVWSDPKNPARRELHFDWTTGPGEGGKKKTDSETLQPDSLVGDMMPDFILAHWNDLAAGKPVNFRFVAQSRLETVGFKLLKDSDVTVRGTAALRLKMQASSFIIAQIVDPIFFVVEKASPHRVLEYEGRTTPKLREGNKWKDLDARTVYDWK
jgi:hypothetical protein